MGECFRGSEHEIRTKLATAVILFLEEKVKIGCWEFFSDGFNVPEGKKVVVTIEIVDAGVQCRGGNEI